MAQPALKEQMRMGGKWIQQVRIVVVDVVLLLLPSIYCVSLLLLPQALAYFKNDRT